MALAGKRAYEAVLIVQSKSLHLLFDPPQEALRPRSRKMIKPAARRHSDYTSANQVGCAWGVAGCESLVLWSFKIGKPDLLYAFVAEQQGTDGDADGQGKEQRKGKHHIVGDAGQQVGMQIEVLQVGELDSSKHGAVGVKPGNHGDAGRQGYDHRWMMDTVGAEYAEQPDGYRGSQCGGNQPQACGQQYKTYAVPDAAKQSCCEECPGWCAE